MHKSENDLMADLEAGLSQPGALARTNGRPMDDSAREDQVIASNECRCRLSQGPYQLDQKPHTVI